MLIAIIASIPLLLQLFVYIDIQKSRERWNKNHKHGSK